MENKDLNLKPELEIIRFAPNDFVQSSPQPGLDDNELPPVIV